MPSKRNSREKRQQKSRERAAAYRILCEGRRKVIQEEVILPTLDEEKICEQPQSPVVSDDLRPPVADERFATITETRVVRYRADPAKEYSAPTVETRVVRYHGTSLVGNLPATEHPVFDDLSDISSVDLEAEEFSTECNGKTVDPVCPNSDECDSLSIEGEVEFCDD